MLLSEEMEPLFVGLGLPLVIAPSPPPSVSSPYNSRPHHKLRVRVVLPAKTKKFSSISLANPHFPVAPTGKKCVDSRNTPSLCRSRSARDPGRLFWSYTSCKRSV